MTTYAIIDVANLFHRMRHVVRGDAFTKSGMTLHIVFRSLRKLSREFKVEHMVFCMEGKSWRYSVYPEYKARRRAERSAVMLNEKEREEQEIFDQTMADFSEFIKEKTRCTMLQRHGVEGDDFVARFIQLHPDDRHYILSGDSDFVQLLSPNVSIFDGVNDRLLTVDGVFDSKGQAMEFSIESSSGKVKVKGKAPKDFVPESEWWRKALFVKLIRGDAGDGIFSAYPGVRFNGSSKKVGICEAWADRHEKGYAWNNFMHQRWSKLVGKDKNDNALNEQVEVSAEYARNQMLIDLTMQPEHVIQEMDETIIAEIQKEIKGNVGMDFLKFCGKHNLPNLAQEAVDHASYLNARYK